jgi:hypothetical protein
MRLAAAIVLVLAGCTATNQSVLIDLGVDTGAGGTATPDLAPGGDLSGSPAADMAQPDLAQQADMPLPPDLMLAPDMKPSCGHLNEPCCPGTSAQTLCTDAWTICDNRPQSTTMKTCVRCGLVATPCCALPDSCVNGLQCVTDGTGSLVCCTQPGAC